MENAGRLSVIWACVFAVSFVVGVPLEWLTQAARNADFVIWMVFAFCATVVAAHYAGPFAVLVAPVTVVLAVAGMYLGGYIPYGLRMGDLQPSDYGCCDMGTGAEGLWTRIKFLSFLGSIAGLVIGAVVWWIESLPIVVSHMERTAREGRPHGTLRR